MKNKLKTCEETIYLAYYTIHQPIPNLIRFCTGHFIDHVGLIADWDPLFQEKAESEDWGNIPSVEETLYGLVHWKPRLWNRCWLWVKAYPVSKLQKEIIKEHYLSFLNSRYRFEGLLTYLMKMDVFRRDDCKFCSELVAESFEKASICLSPYAPHFTAPHHLFHNPMGTTVLGPLFIDAFQDARKEI